MKFILDVDINEKDLAKERRAKWDPGIWKWYYEGDKLPAALRPWYHGDQAEEEPEVKTRDGRTYLNVSEVMLKFNRLLRGSAGFKNLAVMGEVTNYTKGSEDSGMKFFALKDDSSLLQCRIFSWESAEAFRFDLRTGQKVGVIGDFDVYYRNGGAALKVRQIVDLGQGGINLAYEMLKKKLSQEGLFDEEKKRPLPRHPRSIGIMTSKGGKAIGDIVTEIQKRNPYVTLELYDVNVQGANATASMLSGLAVMDKRGYDVIIIGRGGGSDEDLIAYNDEQLARAVAAAATPILSAVGHTDNRALTDFVADKYANTPTAVATMVVQDVNEELDRLERTYRRMYQGISGKLKNSILFVKARMEKLERLGPAARYKKQADRLDYAQKSLARNIERVLEQKNFELERYRSGIRANSPMVKFEKMKNRLERLSEGIKQNGPEKKYEKLKEELGDLIENMGRGIDEAVERRRRKTELLTVRLHALSPTAKLINGFGYISINEEPVTGISRVHPGDELNVTIHDGRIVTQVKNIKEEKDNGE